MTLDAFVASFQQVMPGPWQASVRCGWDREATAPSTRFRGLVFYVVAVTGER